LGKTENGITELVTRCSGHPSSYLRCYQTSGTGRYHICTENNHGQYDRENCEKRYKEATARGMIEDRDFNPTS